MPPIPSDAGVVLSVVLIFLVTIASIVASSVMAKRSSKADTGETNALFERVFG